MNSHSDKFKDNMGVYSAEQGMLMSRQLYLKNFTKANEHNTRGKFAHF